MVTPNIFSVVPLAYFRYPSLSYTPSPKGMYSGMSDRSSFSMFIIAPMMFYNVVQMYANSRNFMIIVVNICWKLVGIVNFNIEDRKVL